MEALEWIRTNKNENPFASNVFDRESVLLMVEALYRAGAEKIVVSEIYSEAQRIEREGGPYSATLLVTLPQDEEIASRVEKTIKSFEPDELDRVGKILRLWWD